MKKSGGSLKDFTLAAAAAAAGFFSPSKFNVVEVDV